MIILKYFIHWNDLKPSEYAIQSIIEQSKWLSATIWDEYNSLDIMATVSWDIFSIARLIFQDMMDKSHGSGIIIHPQNQTFIN